MDQAAKAVDFSVAANLDQVHRALLAGLKTHGHAAGNVEAHAVRGGAVKLQAGIGLGKVVVLAHLNRPVAGVDDNQLLRAPAWVEHMRALVQQKFSRNHGVLRVRLGGSA